MSSIITLDALDEASELSATQDNFPALKHYFPCNEDNGTLTLTDVIGGVVITPDSVTFDGNKATVLTVNANKALTSGVWENPAGKDVVIALVTDKTPTHDIAIGNTASNTRLRGTESVLVVHDGTTPCLAGTTNTANNTDAAYLILFDRDHATEGAKFIRTTDVLYEEGTAGGNATALTLGQPDANITLTGITNVRGIAVFYFDEIPGDIKSFALQLQNDWVADGKTIPAMWKGRG